MHVELQPDERGLWWLRIGDRRWPVHSVYNYDAPKMEDLNMWMRSRGCRLVFESGWDLSILWGTLTYSDNRYACERQWWDTFTETPESVEVGIIDGIRDELAFYPVQVSAEDVIVLADWLAAAPTGDADHVAQLVGFELARFGSD